MSRVFREARDIDKGAVKDLYTACIATGETSWSEYYPNDDILDEDIKHHWLYVLDEAGIIIGAASLLPFDDIETIGLPFLPTDKPCVLCRICVTPEKWHTGLGRLLLTECEAEAAILGYSAMHLLCNVLLQAPNCLYQGAGYERIGEAEMYGHKFWAYEKQFCR